MIEDDLTQREKEVQNCIMEETEIARESGATTSCSHMKWSINNTEFQWNEEIGLEKKIIDRRKLRNERIVENKRMNFRGTQFQGKRRDS